jgi:phospholipase/carboxylesterase
MRPHEGQPVLSAGTPLGSSRAVMIMLHGRNASPGNILELAAHLDRPGFTYLAPAAANSSWYPYSFLTETSKNEPYLSSALRVVDDLVADLLSRGILKREVVLLGFSQGACLAGEYAVRHADRYGGVIMLSGGLIGPPGTRWNHDGSLASTPVVLGCSDVDGHIPKDRVLESGEVFERMGAEVTLRLYPGMGHQINEDEMRLARAAMDRVLADRPQADGRATSS